MKSKKIKLLFLALFLLPLCVVLLGAGCEKEPQYEIYENHEISACGVEEPLKNLEWLEELCNKVKEQKSYSSFYIHMLKVIDKDEYVFEISYPSQYDEHYSSIRYFDCSGSIVFEWETVNPPSSDVEDFDKGKEFISTIFSMVKE